MVCDEHFGIQLGLEMTHIGDPPRTSLRRRKLIRIGTRLAGFLPSAAIAAVALPRASWGQDTDFCPVDLDGKLSVGGYRFQFQSWSDVAPQRQTQQSGPPLHFICHCVRSDNNRALFVSWKGTDLVGFAEANSPLYSYRKYPHNDFRSYPAELWYGARPSRLDTDIIVPIEKQQASLVRKVESGGSVSLPGEALVRAAWRADSGPVENLQRLRQLAEKAAPSEFMRAELSFVAFVQSSDQRPSGIWYNGSYRIETRGNKLTGLYGLRVGSDTIHQALFKGLDVPKLVGDGEKIYEKFGAVVPIPREQIEKTSLGTSQLMIVAPDGKTPLAGVGISVFV